MLTPDRRICDPRCNGLRFECGISAQIKLRVYEGFCARLSQSQLVSLPRVLPEYRTTDAGEILYATFEEVFPSPGNDYIFHPRIKNFLDETSLDSLAVDKGKRENYRGTSVSQEIKFCFCDEASFSFSAFEPSFLTASSVSDGSIVSATLSPCFV